MCNEIHFLKQKLNFLYNNFEQLIFVDYDIMNQCNSKDGSIQYIENFNDEKKKIKLIKITKNKLDNIKIYNGISMIEKRKMFAEASKYIKDDIDIIWATDLDEFFNEKLIRITEKKFLEDPSLITLNIPHYIFIYNQYNIFNGRNIKNTSYICPPRITKHIKNKIYGHCNFDTYGKTIKCNEEFIYHYAYIGYNRNKFKLNIYNKDKNKSKNRLNNKFLKIYYNNLIKNNKYIDIFHPNIKLRMKSIKYDNNHPEYINLDEMIKNLNKI
jgi:hypothetical protein